MEACNRVSFFKVSTLTLALTIALPSSFSASASEKITLEDSEDEASTDHAQTQKPLENSIKQDQKELAAHSSQLVGEKRANILQEKDLKEGSEKFLGRETTDKLLSPSPLRQRKRRGHTPSSSIQESPSEGAIPPPSILEQDPWQEENKSPKALKLSSPSRRHMERRYIYRHLRNSGLKGPKINLWLKLKDEDKNLHHQLETAKPSCIVLGIWQAEVDYQRNPKPPLQCMKESFRKIFHDHLFEVQKHDWQTEQFLHLLTLLIENPDITHLKLFECHVNDAQVASLAALTHLQNLTLKENEVTNKGAQILAEHPSLKTLDLSGNKVGTAGAYALSGNTILEKLYLYKNQITDEGAQALALNQKLTFLDLQSNNISDRGAEALAQNTRLKTLMLKDNNITEAGARKFLVDSSLTDLNLEEKKFSSDLLVNDEDQQILMKLGFEMGGINVLQLLKSETSREEFWKKLSGLSRQLSDEEQRAILNVLKNQRKIRKLYLRHFFSLNNNVLEGLNLYNLNHLRLYDCQALSSESFILFSQFPLETFIFGLHSSLERIDNRGKSLLFNSLKFLKLTECPKLKQISIKGPLLEHLELSSCSVLEAESLDTISRYSPLKVLSLQNCDHLKNVDINRLPLLPILTTSPGQNLKFTYLNLSHLVHADKFKSMSRALNARPYLTSIDFTKCQITDDLLTHFLNLTHLQVLNLKSNLITDQGVKILTAHPTVKSLNLKNNYIGQEGVKLLAKSSLLTSLNLAHNFIEDKGVNDLSTHKSLTFLDISDNINITRQGIQSVTHMTTLTALKLRNIPLHELSLELLVKNKKLIGLNFARKSSLAIVSAAPASIQEKFIQLFAGNKQLKFFNIQDHVLSFESFHSIAQNASLTSLNISNTIRNQKVWSQNQGIEVQASRVLQFLTQLKSLSKLEAADNYMTWQEVEVLFKIPSLTWLNLESNEIELSSEEKLQPNSHLSWLNLKKNQLSDQSISLLLSSYPKLTSLNVANNKIGREGVISLAQHSNLTKLKVNAYLEGEKGLRAFEKNTTLKSLYLQGSNDYKIDDRGAQALGKNCTLTRLNVINNSITDKGALALACHPSLTCLKIGNNNIGRQGIQALGQNSLLTYLDLWGNNKKQEIFLPEDFRSFAHNTRLLKLNLTNMNLKDECIQELADCTTLTELNLSSNKLTDHGLEGLKRNSRLRVLNLQSNKIKNKGACSLASSPSLLFLNLSFNSIKDQGAQALIENTSLRVLNLSSNKSISENTKKSLKQKAQLLDFKI